MNANLRKNFQELSFLLQYFKTRLGQLKGEGILTTEFIEFVKSCSLLAKKIDISILENDYSFPPADSYVPAIETVNCSGCKKRLETENPVAQYMHNWGWNANIYLCPDCGDETSGIQPNNMPDLFAFTDLCKKHLTGRKKSDLPEKERKELRSLLRKMKLNVDDCLALREQMLQEMRQQKKLERELSERLEEYCSVLQIEKFRLESGNQQIGNC